MLRGRYVCKLRLQGRVLFMKFSNSKSRMLPIALGISSLRSSIDVSLLWETSPFTCLQRKQSKGVKSQELIGKLRSLLREIRRFWYFSSKKRISFFASLAHRVALFEVNVVQINTSNCQYDLSMKLRIIFLHIMDPISKDAVVLTIGRLEFFCWLSFTSLRAQVFKQNTL